MSESIRTWLLGMTGVALLSAVALLFARSGGMKRTVRLISGAAMACVLLSPLLQFDYAAYAGMLQLYRESAVWDASRVEETGDRLNRSIIESECGAYILDKAEQLGLPLSEARVAAQWSTDGVWYPYSAELIRADGGGRDAALSGIIEADLGIPSERQEWRENVQ